MVSSKTVVKKAMDALFKNFNEKEIREYFTTDYIQHNPHVPSGLEPIIELLPSMQEAGFSFTTHRVIEDGNLVLTHNTGNNAIVFGSKEIVTFDIWRVKEGKVVEHWDCIIPKYIETASGRSQVDGETEVMDLDKTEENKALVKSFVSDVLIPEDFSKIDNYISNGLYDQHNPLVKDGPKALQEVIADSGLKNHKIHKVIGEGNFVLAQCEGIWKDKPVAIYDLFRVAEGQIVEHWDVIQEIPVEMAHNNSMF